MTSRRIRIFFFAALTASAITMAGCASMQGESWIGSPTLLPGVRAEMNSPGFWISRHPAPDALILRPEEISQFNADVRTKKMTRDLSAFDIPDGNTLKKELGDAFAWISKSPVYTKTGSRVSARILEPVARTMNADALPYSIQARYVFTVRQTNLRVLPTDDVLLDQPNDPYVDNLQASSLDPGTPAVALHESADGRWIYAETEFASGWIHAEDAAVANRDEFLARYLNADYLVATSARAEIYRNPGMTDFFGYARMGTRIAPATKAAGQGDVTEILIPARDAEGRFVEARAWVASADVSRGNLPFTARTIYRQAFKFLNAPYGWGGMYGEQDCSQFLCEVYATVGIKLPRNSSKQAKVGIPIPEFAQTLAPAAKIAALREQGTPAATILRLPGHIMLYLGTIDGTPYVIHETLGYREKAGFRERARLINRVTVSTLDLGVGSSKTSHLERLTTAARIAPPAAMAQSAQ